MASSLLYGSLTAYTQYVWIVLGHTTLGMFVQNLTSGHKQQGRLILSSVRLAGSLSPWEQHTAH